MTLNDLEPSEKVFIVNFLQNFALRHAFQEWIAPKWLDIDQDNLRMKFSAWNVDFSSPSPEMDGDRLRLPANRNCYRLSRVLWPLLRFLVVVCCRFSSCNRINFSCCSGSCCSCKCVMRLFYIRQSKVLEMVEKNYRTHCSVANIVRHFIYLLFVRFFLTFSWNLSLVDLNAQRVCKI